MHNLLPGRADPAAASADPTPGPTADPTAATADVSVLLLQQCLRKQRVLRQQSVRCAMLSAVAVPFQPALHHRRRMRERLQRSLPVPEHPV